MQQDSILVKLDFENAFNSLYRDQMLLTVYGVLPELAAYCNLAYAEATELKFWQLFTAITDGSTAR